jgi:bifunctional enzyme CysN/CysC
MAHQSDLIAEDILGYLKQQEEKSLLRFITCGSVDDGKSTLIGRLLWDSKLIFEDQLASLESDSKRVGTQGGDIDFALLLDGLQAEREQGITIDVAYRFFSTDKRKFIVADTPGHEQYTRNMATGASTADLAVILVDARKGILTQTRRHSFITSLMGIKHIVLAVNKMDLVAYDQARFDAIQAEYLEFAQQLNFQSITCIPMSALKGDNIIDRSAHTEWYTGQTLMGHLETIEVISDAVEKPFRLPVQWVNRPNLDFRGFSGTIASGRIAVGDRVVVGASGQTSKVARIVTFDGDLPSAFAGQAVTLTLEDEIDISRGDVLAIKGNEPEKSEQLAAYLVWMHEQPLLTGRGYLLKIGTRTIPATITRVEHKVNVNTLEEQAGNDLQLNEVGMVSIALDAPLPMDPYATVPATGSFILIDRLSNATIAAGTIDHLLKRGQNTYWQKLDVDQKARENQKEQKACVVWLTGLPASGKTTIANIVEKKLYGQNKHTYTLDGDNVRQGLGKDLGFSDADRIENIRRISEVAKMLADSGLIVFVSVISPFENERDMAKAIIGENQYLEVFVDTPLAECEARDPKGLYKKARAGEITHFTGISSQYEAPVQPDLVVQGSKTATAEDQADKIIDLLHEKQVIWDIDYPTI